MGYDLDVHIIYGIPILSSELKKFGYSECESELDSDSKLEEFGGEGEIENGDEKYTLMSCPNEDRDCGTAIFLAIDIFGGDPRIPHGEDSEEFLDELHELSIIDLKPPTNDQIEEFKKFVKNLKCKGKYGIYMVQTSG